MKGGTGRHASRKFVMESLYRYDLINDDPEVVLDRILKREEAEGEAAQFARDLVRVVKKNLKEIDTIIQRISDNWSIDRITYIDRAILRLAIGEMMGIPDVPFKVSINEAVELAKEFSTEDSGAFVNGILDAVAAELGHKEKGGK
jgi:N utilization substance protein B